MARKGKNKRQQWRRQQQKAKKKQNKETKKQKEYYEVQAKWFQDSIRLCRERFQALCEAENTKVVDSREGVPPPEAIMESYFEVESANKEMADLLKSVDELATIWATREWPSHRAHLLKKFIGKEHVDETIADMMDKIMPEMKEIEMKKLKVGFKSKCGLPLTTDEHTCIQTGVWGWEQAAKGYMTPQEEKESWCNFFK